MAVKRVGEHRFVALDSLRGICACSVIVYHMTSTGLLTNLPFFRSAWALVDFFFVLSGFVIAASYGERLRSGFPIREFMILRLGRIYPLHLAMVLAYLALEITAAVVGTGGTTDRAPLTDTRSIPSLFSNLFLLQIFGFHHTETWNGPSWSIAAEMWAYLLAAVGLALVPRFRMLVAIAVAVSGLVLLTVGDAYLDRTYSWALVRCIYGFGLGMLAFGIFQQWQSTWQQRAGAVAFAQVAALVGCIVALSLGPLGPAELALPWLFAATVLAFSTGSRWPARMLCARPLVFLGTISYSIYMVHMFVAFRFVDVLTVVGRRTGHVLTVVRPVEQGGGKVIVGAGMVPDLIVLAAIAVSIMAAWISYRLIELPFRNWSRRWAVNVGGRKAAPAESIAPTM